MKIVYLSNARMPTEKAHGLQIIKMCEAFAERAEVELIVPRRFNPLIEDPFAYYGVSRNFKITRLFCLDLISYKMGRIGYWIEMVTFLLSAKLYLLFKKYDILYTREFAVGNFFAKYILEIHDLPKVATKYHIRSWHNSGKLIVLTRFLKEDLVIQGIEAGKICTSPDGVDLDEFASDSLPKVPGGRKTVMYTGSFFLYGWKGIDTLIEASKWFPNGVETVLIGGTPKEILEMEATSADRPVNSLRFIGRVSHALIPAHLQSADVLVLPNKKGDANSERYTSPLKLFEYMASGVPIVASDLSSMREVLNEQNCTFFSAGDPTSLASAVGSVLNDSVTAQKKAKQALMDVKRYTWQERADNILNFIQ